MRLQANLLEGKSVPTEVIVDPNNLGTLLNITAENAINTSEAVYVSLESAKKGISFAFQAQTDVYWEMGDGEVMQTAAGKSFTYQYNEPGIYVVMAIGQNSFGQKVVQAKGVVVSGSFADFTIGKRAPKTKEEIVLDASASARNAEFTGGKATDYTWTCSGGAGCFQEIKGKKISVNFQVPGTYAITLQVDTSIGATDYRTQEILVSGEKPFAYFEAKTAFGPQNAGTYFLDGTYSTTRSGEKKGLTYFWNINGKEIETEDPILEHRFKRAGTHSIELFVEEEGFVYESETWKEALEVGSVLAVDFEVDPEEAFVGKSVTFTAKSLNALLYSWKFPNGKEERTETVYHAFSKSGRKRVSLEVSAGETKNMLEKVVLVRNSNKPTGFTKIIVNGLEKTAERITIHKGDLLRIETNPVDQFGKEKEFRETWLVNGEVVAKKDVPTLFTEFGEYEVKYIIIDHVNPSQRDEQVFIFSVENKPPLIGKVVFSQPGELPVGSIRVSAQAADPEREKLTYIFKALSYTTEVARQESSKGEVIFTLPNGVFDFEILVRDESGKESTKFVDADYVINGVQNEIPTGQLALDPSYNILTTTDLIVRANTKDEDGDALYYTWMIDGEVIQEGDSSVFQGYRFERAGEYNLEVEVDDKRGGVAHLKRVITVGWDPRVRTKESNTAPNANICSEQGTTVMVGKPVVFQSQAQDSDNDNLDYRWSIEGQQNVSQLPNLSYTFKKPGKYNVNLEVKDAFETVKKSFAVNVSPEGVILPLQRNTCPQNLDTTNEYASYWSEGENVLPTKTNKDFFKNIAWFDHDQKEDWISPKSLSGLEAFGLVGISKKQSSIETVLTHREEVLLKLKQTTQNQAIIKKIDEELFVLKNTPRQSLKNYLETLRPQIDNLSYAYKVKADSAFSLSAKVPEDITVPFSFEWDLGNGQTKTGQQIMAHYPDPGFYVLTLTLRDGLTEATDSIIIQVDSRS